MWSLKHRLDGSFVLAWDRERRYDHNFPGLWEFVGKASHAETPRLVEANLAAGYMCCIDNEGNVRALVLTREVQYA